MNEIINGYNSINLIKECYNSLYDDLSKNIFCARLNADIAPSIKNINDIANLAGYNNKNIIDELPWIENLINKKIPIYMYGAGIFSSWWYEKLSSLGVNIVAFIDRNYERLVNHCGIPVIAPPFQNNKWQNVILNDAMILITATVCENEIYNLLCKSGFPKERILPKIGYLVMDVDNQYFDFMDKLKPDGAFIDGGSYNCDTVVRYLNITHSKNKIFVFEPDEKSYQDCLKTIKLHNIQNVECIKAGLWHETTELNFSATNSGGSCLSDSGNTTVSVVKLDDIVKENKISFIKMDIEGAELNALIGANHILKRDKPLCAISVYHKAGDLLAIMEYLKNLVPEYKFAVRHYSLGLVETVLYAFE